VESAAAFDFHIAPLIEAEEAERAAAEAARDPAAEPVQEEAPRSRGRFRGGRETLALDYLQSQRRRHLVMMEMAEAMEGWDMFVSGRGQVGLTNQTGNPAVVVPYDFGGDNPQPRTTTLIGNLFADDKLLNVAHAYQMSTDWHLRRPDLSGIV
jgi:Asp-tRNA(Asn)/Glu-tRNA(Gln) amidotransferase A subunit family amidase